MRYVGGEFLLSSDLDETIRNSVAVIVAKVRRITKRLVDALQANDGEFTAWDDTVSGFGVRVRPTGAKSYVVVYRAGAGRGAPVRRYTIAAVGKITPERARARAKVILGAVAHGHDPASQKTAERGTPTVAELADQFMADHVRPKRKAGTAEFYQDILDRIVKPAVGTTKADKLTRLQVGRLHSSLAETPFQANRMLAVVGSMYAFAGRNGIVPEGTHPVRGIDKFKESRRERFLTGDELELLGSAIREAETTGIPWTVDETKPAAKHVPKNTRFTRISLSAAAALRLLLFTGCRLREILHLRWEHVDFERGCLFLPDSKSGRKTVILNAPALAVLNVLERLGPYVVPGDDPTQPRHDLKRPWDAYASGEQQKPRCFFARLNSQKLADRIVVRFINLPGRLRPKSITQIQIDDIVRTEVQRFLPRYRVFIDQLTKVVRHNLRRGIDRR